MQAIVEDRRLPVDIDAQPVVQAAAALKPTLRHYQDYSPQAFRVQTGIFRDVLRAISPPR